MGLGLTLQSAEEVVWMKSWTNTSRVAFHIKVARDANSKRIYFTNWRGRVSSFRWGRQTCWILLDPRM